MRATVTTLVAAAMAAGCASGERASETSEALCTVDNPGCPTAWTLVNATRYYTGDYVDKISCSPIHTDPGQFYATCVVSVANVVLLTCSVNYEVDDDENVTLLSLSCH